jgi:hypothetical protein
MNHDGVSRFKAIDGLGEVGVDVANEHPLLLHTSAFYRALG